MNKFIYYYFVSCLCVSSLFSQELDLIDLNLNSKTLYVSLGSHCLDFRNF